MFRSRFTRPLVWAIPLATIGAVVAAVWYFRPLEIGVDGVSVNCRDLLLYPGAQYQCATLQLERLLVSGLILVVGAVPLVLAAVRACVLAADAVADLSEDVQRLRERLDHGRSG